MVERKRYTWLNILVTTIWILMGMATLVLLVAAINKKKNQRCRIVDIQITGVENNYFIDKSDIIKMLEKFSNTKLEGKPINSFNLSAIEGELQKSEWIKHAELYFDNNNVLKVNIVEREPIARVFCNNGSSFYIDTARVRLPLSEKFSARLPVFTNFPTENIVLSMEDSNLLTGIKTLSEFISKDSFWMAQIEQVDITPEKTFEMIPKVGQQVIVFGNANNYKQKFNNLLVFYRQVESKVGWNKYAKINVRYGGQIIAEKRGVQEIKMDSLRTIQLMKLLVANALKQANDTIHNVQLIQPSDDNIIPSPGIDDKSKVENNDIRYPAISKNPVAKSEMALMPLSKERSNHIPKPKKKDIKTKPEEQHKGKPKTVVNDY